MCDMAEQQELWDHNQGAGPTPAGQSTQGEVQPRREGELNPLPSHSQKTHPSPPNSRTRFCLFV